MTATDRGPIDRLPLASWRLAVATVAMLGVGFAATSLDLWWQALSQQANLLATLVYFALAVTGLVRPETDWRWLRGAVATTLVLVAGGFAVLMNGGLDEPYSLLEHLVTPALVVADTVLVRRGTDRWWWPLTWVALPLAYLVYYVYADVLLYDFLDPYGPDYQATVLGFLVATVAIGYAISLLGHARLNSLVPSREPTYARDTSNDIS